MESKTHPDKSFREIYTCYHCEKTFSRKFNLSRHLPTCPKNKNLSRAQVIKKVKCSLCLYEDSQVNVLQHYNLQHGIEISTESFEFNDLNEFEKWKSETEKNQISKYIRYATRKSGTKTHYYYRCHRDGFYKSCGKNIRRMKVMGSNKIGGFCPSKLNVTVGNGKVSVQFVKTHVGHQMDLHKIPLPKSTRDSLASKLSQKIPFDEIINGIRDNVNENNKIERVHLITRKDLYNIEQLYNLKNSIRQIKNSKGEASTELRELRKRHRIVEQIKDKPTIEEREENWILSSATGHELCRIERANIDCACDLRCMKCDACIHAYLCSCPDSSIERNMCKHIHLLCQSVDTDDNDLYIHCDDTVEDKEIVWGQVTESKTCNLDKYKDKLFQKFQSILKGATTMEKCRAVEEAFGSLEATLVAMDSVDS